MFLVLACLPACYVNTPLDASVRPVAPGMEVALDISDQGRVNLAERFGPGVTQIEGRLTAVTDRDFRLRVFKVSYLREGDSRWTGEDVTIATAHVGRVYERTLSRGRTAAAAAGFGGGLIAFLVTRALVGAGRDRDPEVPPPGPDEIRIPLLRISH